MSPFVGVVYKWKDPFLGASFWKEYRLSLDEQGWLVWSKVTGEVKAVARLHVIFPQIRCQPLDAADPRVSEAVVRVAPYTLVIPMKLQYGGRSVENVELATRTLDDLQSWMGRFATGLGASQQFAEIERAQGQTFRVSADRFDSLYPRANALIYRNRNYYAPDYYPTLWSSFQTCGVDYQRFHGGAPISNINDDIWWMYPGGDTFTWGGPAHPIGSGTFPAYGGGGGIGGGGRPSGGDAGFSYGGDDGSFSYGGDSDRDHGGDHGGDGGFSYGGDDGSFSYGGDTGGGGGTDSGGGNDGGGFSHGGDTGGGGGGGDDGGFSYGGDTGGNDGGDTGGGAGGGDDGGFSYGGDSGGDTSGDAGFSAGDSGGGGDGGFSAGDSGDTSTNTTTE